MSDITRVRPTAPVKETAASPADAMIALGVLLVAVMILGVAGWLWAVGFIGASLIVGGVVRARGEAV